MNLNHFQQHEFVRSHVIGKDIQTRNWFLDMDQELLVRVDVLRSLINMPILISTAIGSLGRTGGNTPSYHNITRWGKVMAMDVFPDGIKSWSDAMMVVNAAEACGIRGIGWYPNWRMTLRGGRVLKGGFHLDSGMERRPAIWIFKNDKLEVLKLQ